MAKSDNISASVLKDIRSIVDAVQSNVACSSRFQLRALQQNRTQSRLLYLLIKKRLLIENLILSVQTLSCGLVCKRERCS